MIHGRIYLITSLTNLGIEGVKLFPVHIYASGCFTGALIRMCVPSMTSIILGNPGSVCSSKFCIMTCISSSVRKRNIMMGYNSKSETI